MTRRICGLSPGLLAAIVCHAAVAPVVLLTAPAIAAQYATQLHLSAGQIGFLFSGELAAMSLATLPAYYWQPRFDWRRVALAAVLLFIAANIASIFAGQFATLLPLRMLSALGGGTLMVLCLSGAVLSPQRDRVYAYWVCGQLVLGAIGLWILPGLFARFGLAALYGGLAALMALTLPLVRCYPQRLARPGPATGTASASGDRMRAAWGILGLLAFYIGLSGVWTFIGGIGNLAGIAEDRIGELLAIASILGIAGALTASVMGARLPRGLALLIGYGGMIAAILLLCGAPMLWRFALAAFGFKFVWTFVLPFVLATISDLDRDGRLMSTANLMVGAGLAIGPAISGQILQQGLGFDAMLLFSAALTGISLLAILCARRGAFPTTKTRTA